MSERKIRMGILGFGLFGEKSLIPGYEESKYAELVAITKQNLEEARSKAKQYRIPLAYSYAQKNEMLANPDIDAIFVAGPNHIHLIDTIDALRAGKDVIVEKPMAMNSKECEQMISVAKETGRKLMIAHVLRYPDAIQYVKKILDSKTLGELVSGTCDFMSDGAKSLRKWKFNKKVAGGGAAFDLGVHLIDTLRYLSGQDVVATHCIHHPEKTSSDEVDIFSSFLMQFDHGFVGRVNSSYLGSRNTYLEIFGTKGYIRAYDWNNVNTPVRVEMQIEGGNVEIKTIQNHNHYAVEIDLFAHAILNNMPVPISGEDGLKNQRIIDLVNL